MRRQTLQEAKFVEQNGKFVWVETHVFPIEDTACIFVMHSPGDEPHMVYKLQQHCANEDNNEKKFSWYGLWNTCVISGVPQKGTRRYKAIFDTMEEAIKAMLDDGRIVRRIYFSDLQYLKFEKPMFN